MSALRRSLKGMVNPLITHQLAREQTAELGRDGGRWPASALSHGGVRRRLGRSLIGLGTRLAEGSRFQLEREDPLRPDAGPHGIHLVQPVLEGRSLLR
jgi:hypothetical protein